MKTFKIILAAALAMSLVANAATFYVDVALTNGGNPQAVTFANIPNGVAPTGVTVYCTGGTYMWSRVSYLPAVTIGDKACEPTSASFAFWITNKVPEAGDVYNSALLGTSQFTLATIRVKGSNKSTSFANDASVTGFWIKAQTATNTAGVKVGMINAITDALLRVTVAYPSN